LKSEPERMLGKFNEAVKIISIGWFFLIAAYDVEDFIRLTFYS